MIIRTSADDEREEDVVLDLEAFWFVTKKYGLILGLVSVSVAVVVYLLATIFAGRISPDRAQVEFIAQPRAIWALPATGDAIIDALIPVFEPNQELPNAFAKGLPEAEWTELLKEVGLKPAQGGPLKPSAGIRVLGEDGKTLIEMKTEIRTPRNKAPLLVIGGPIPQKDLESLTARWAQMLNEKTGHRYLEAAKEKKEKLDEAIAEAGKNHLENLERARALSSSDPRTKDSYIFPLLYNWSQRRVLFDRLLEALNQNSLSHPVFVVGKPTLPVSSVPRRPMLFFAGAFLAAGLAGISYLLFLGAPSRRILGEAALASLHPRASIYYVPRDTAVLGRLLSASMARLGGEKGKKMAAFIPQEQSSLIETVRLAAEKSGHTFTAQGSTDKEVCVFASEDPSDEISRLPSQGFTRIILTAKKGETMKSLHVLLQAEADLAGIPVTDVILIED